MKRGADVVIIGAGVHGCATAYNLAKKGCRDVVVVDKSQVASGASGRCPGGFRHQWSSKADIVFMTECIRMLTGLQEELDYPDDLEIRQIGYLFLIYSEAQQQLFAKNIELQRSLGIPVETLTTQRMKDIVPPLNTDNVIGGALCSWDGRANPYLVTHAYARAAKRLGVEINTETCVTDILTNDGKVTGVVTDRGTIETNRVVCAAGAHSLELGQKVGLDLPLRPERRQVLVSERREHTYYPALLARHVAYFQTAHGIAMSEVGVEASSDYETANTMETIVRTAAGWKELIPVRVELKAVRWWAGTYDMTPDAHPIIGPMPGFDGFFLSAGYSGHGFQMHPVAARTMAEMVMGETPSIDISPFDIHRFKKSEQIVEKMVW